MTEQKDFNIEEGKTMILGQIKELSKYISADDVERIASTTGLTIGTVRQIRKGQTFNMKAALMLLEAGRENKTAMEKMIREAIDG